MNDIELWASLEAGFGNLRSDEEAEAFLRAICTRKELTNLRHRWEAFQRVRQGATQAELRVKLGFGKITAGRCAEAFRDNREIIETVASRAASGRRNKKR